MALTLETSGDVCETTLTVTGPPGEVGDYVAQYLRDYPRAWYGTEVLREHYRIDGAVEVRLRRANCCD